MAISPATKQSPQSFQEITNKKGQHMNSISKLSVQGLLDPAEESRPHQDPPENLLAHYFRDVATLPVLRTDEEFGMARNIESQEVALWSHLMSYPQIVEPLLGFVEQRLDERLPEFSQLRRSCRAYRARTVASSRRRYERCCEAAAKKMRLLDVDRVLLEDLLDHLERFSKGYTDSVFVKKLRVNVQSKAFKTYHRRVRLLQASSLQARNTFVQANLRLVVTIARRFNYGHIPFHDLIQEGNIGLIKAVGRYDHRRGFRFSTYASWWIRHAITRAIADKGRLVRVPVHMLSTFQKVARTSRELSSKLGRPPTSEEICYSTSLSIDKVEQIQEHLPNQSLSLDSPISDDDDRRFIELVQDMASQSPSDRIGDQEVYKQVQYIFSDLKPIEADVLRKRFGLHDGKEYTLSDIGLSYDLSRERIRQIQEQALGKIRRALMRRNAM
jgi:RNA polymerase primary sigma factor